ncbi:MAG: gluconeogenesis factor YvcK family protein [Bacillota bacterium]|jgi:uncharacterized cofD-like protein
MPRITKWLYPGIGIKRWLALITAGILLLALGAEVLWGWQLLSFVELRLLNIIGLFTGQSYGRAVGVGALLLCIGLLTAALGVRGAVRSLARVFLPKQEEQLVDLLVEQNVLARAPRIVVIGGGTGLPVLLRGLKELTSNLTAIVTVADDGGSSGRLRGELGILPPGDIRNCLLALATTEPLLERLFQHRFNSGSGLEGHSFGNLFIAAMSEITGDFEKAVKESSKVLAVRGRVLPVTLQDIVLCAEMEDGSTVCGESSISASSLSVKRVFLRPKNVEPLPEALAAIEEADAIVLGPGSLFTSVIPNLLVPGVVEAIAASAAVRIYVCNVMTQPGETDGFTAADHLQALLAHSCPGLIDQILVNSERIEERLLQRYHAEGADVVSLDQEALEAMGVKVVAADLISQDEVVRHDPSRLAQAVFGLALRRTMLQEARKLHQKYVKRMKQVEL